MKQSLDYPYLSLVQEVLDNGRRKSDRTGTGTISIFGAQRRFNISGGTIPMLTTKKMFTRGVIREILWYLQGNTNINYLLDHNVHIWDEWANEDGDLGPVYGKQWRNWEHTTIVRDKADTVEHADGSSTNFNVTVNTKRYDQIAEVIHTLRTNPDSRRIIVNSWNVGELDQMALPPCHAFFQFYSSVNPETGERELSSQLYQRSCDVGLGVPFNIVQYSILTHMIAQVTGHKAREFVWTGGDVHIYTNHIEALQEQLTRTPYQSPYLELNPDVKEIDDFTYEDFKIVGYESHPTIKMEVSV